MAAIESTPAVKTGTTSRRLSLSQHMDHLETSKLSVPLFLYQTYKLCCQHTTDNNISLAGLRGGCNPPAVKTDVLSSNTYKLCVEYYVSLMFNNSSKKNKVFGI